MLKRFLRWLVDSLISRPVFIWKSFWLGISDSWLRYVFGELVQLELLDWTELAPDIFVMNDGATLMLRDNNGTWAINQNKLGEIYVHQKIGEHEVKHEGMVVKTHWHEIYRTNKLLKGFWFYIILQKIIEDGDYALREE